MSDQTRTLPPYTTSPFGTAADDAPTRTGQAVPGDHDVQANPQLTPNLVKAILQYTAQSYQYDALTQGAGFLNVKGAVDLARFLKNPQAGQRYPSSYAWSKTIIWGNQKLQKGVIKPAGSAWASR